jgi:hypothetical protein
MRVINAAWEDDAKEREQERKALEVSLVEVPEGAEDYEQHNLEQRIRRGAFAAALDYAGYPVPQDRALRAAERYPLKKRVPKVIPDPHCPNDAWRYSEADTQRLARFEFRAAVGRNAGKWCDPEDEPAGLHWTAERIRALTALLNDPWTWDDDASVEGDAAP